MTTETEPLTSEQIEKAWERCERATPGPWSIESCGEKGDGANMIGVAFGPEDLDAACPLEGWLKPYDDAGNEIEYYRDELVAVCDHTNRSCGPDAVFIAAARTLLPRALSTIASLTRRNEQHVAAYDELARDLAKVTEERDEVVRSRAESREKLIMHLAHVGAWLSDLSTFVGVIDAKDVNDAVTKIRDKVAALASRAERAEKERDNAIGDLATMSFAHTMENERADDAMAAKETAESALADSERRLAEADAMIRYMNDDADLPDDPEFDDPEFGHLAFNGDEWDRLIAESHARFRSRLGGPSDAT